MDKRWNTRVPVTLDLVINYPAVGLLRGRATNISSKGMFIETALCNLCNNCDIEVTMPSSTAPNGCDMLKALIVHNNNKGIGVKFKRKDINFNQWIAQ